MKPGTYCRVPFGKVGRTQIAHVVGETRNGLIRVRSWHGTYKRWAENTRTYKPDDIMKVSDFDKLPPLPGAK